MDSSDRDDLLAHDTAADVEVTRSSMEMKKRRSTSDAGAGSISEARMYWLILIIGIFIPPVLWVGACMLHKYRNDSRYFTLYKAFFYLSIIQATISIFGIVAGIVVYFLLK